MGGCLWALPLRALTSDRPPALPQLESPTPPRPLSPTSRTQRREPLPTGHPTSCLCHLHTAQIPVPKEEAELALLLRWLPSPTPFRHRLHVDLNGGSFPSTLKPPSPCMLTGVPRACPLAHLPLSHPPERAVHAYLYFLPAASFLSPRPPWDHSEVCLCRAMSRSPCSPSLLFPASPALPVLLAGPSACLGLGARVA